MTFSDDCPCGRSQDLTFVESCDKFLVDRKTFDELLVIFDWCTDELLRSRFRDCDNFFKALDASWLDDSAEPSDSLEIRKASLLLNYYHDIIPETLKEVGKRLDEAKEILDCFRTVSKSFRGR
jgi:hypothetical protein